MVYKLLKPLDEIAVYDALNILEKRKKKGP
jgi:hypothetical protein